MSEPQNGQPQSGTSQPRPSLRRRLIFPALFFVGGLAVAGWVATRTDLGSSFIRHEPVQPIAIDPGKLTSEAAQDRSAADTSAKIAELESRIAAGTSAQSIRISTSSDRVSGLVLAFAARRALERGQQLGPVGDELRTHFATSAPHLVAAIESAAAQPVTLADLKSEFELLAPKLNSAGDGWFSSIGSSLSSLIRIRNSSAPSSDPAFMLAEARRLLDLGQVGSALTLVARLPGKGKALGWMAKAKRYSDADAALNALEAKAFEAAPVVEAPAPVVPETSQPPAPLVLPDAPTGTSGTF